MKTKMLIFGLPGSGKTTLAKKLVGAVADSMHINADAVRSAVDDWDFSQQGRIQQAHRMHQLSEASNAALVVCDFVCPYQSTRDALFNDYFQVFMDTIKSSRFADTDAIFEHVNYCDFRITNFDQTEIFIKFIVDLVVKPSIV
jgi:adenylylsulfate kinase-like enzyme